MTKSINCFLCVIFACLHFLITRGELFTAITDLEKLIETEQLIVNSLDSYLVGEERRLKQLKIIRNSYAELHNIASRNVQEYLANPVNAYIMVKRLTKDWAAGELI